MAKYWSFSFSIIASKEIPGLISFRMDWLDLFITQILWTGGYTAEIYFSTVLQAGKSKIKAPADVVSADGLFSGLQTF